MPVEIVWNKQAQFYTLHSPVGPMGRHMRKIGRRIEAAAKVQAGKDSMELVQSIRHRVYLSRGRLQLEVVATAPHAYYHHEGTLPHIITPNRAKVLRFTSGAKVVYAKVVMHPGTKPNRFLADNLILVKS